MKKQKVIGFRVDEKLEKAIEQAASKKDLKISQWIRWAIERALGK